MMTLLELSVQYHAQAEALRARIAALEGAPQAQDPGEAGALLLQARVRMLRTMWREARDLAVLTARYYERGYRRNAKYTL